MKMSDRMFKSQSLGAANLTPLRLGIVAALLFIIINGIFLIRSFSDVKMHQGLVAHTYRVLSGIDQVFSLLKDAETGARGFTLTNDPSYLEPYDLARVELASSLRHLKTILADNPSQLQSADLLERVVNERMEIIAAGVTPRLENLEPTAPDVKTMGRGRSLMSQVRTLVQGMKDEEERLMALRVRQFEESRAFIDISLIITMLLNICLAIATYILFKRSFKKQIEERWLRDGLALVSLNVSGIQSMEDVARNTLTSLSQSLPFGVGSISLVEGDRLKRIGTYGVDESVLRNKEIPLTASLAGEAIRQKRIIHLDSLPKDYLRINSHLGDAAPSQLIVAPLAFEDEVLAVVELGTAIPFNELPTRMLETSLEVAGRALYGARNQSRLQTLLEETQTQSEELQTQQEELRVTNEELTEQATALAMSQDRLKLQQEELRRTNEQLEEQAGALIDQQKQMHRKTKELEIAKVDLEIKAKALAQASQYKSEFLANMSHELRTPLNSMLILSTLLKENAQGNLSEEQISFAETIRGAGNDLLNLINDILDLSKVEAGRLEIYAEGVRLPDLLANLDRSFRQLAERKGLDFRLVVEENCPPIIVSDQKRLEQILKNFLSNAFKFTEKGLVELSVGRPTAGLSLERLDLQRGEAVAFYVRDSGIGIPKDKQQSIFEAFSQADTSTSRKYGGTGLGLTICKELAALLGGELVLESEPGRGSIFSLVVPEKLALDPEASDAKPTEGQEPSPAPLEAKTLPPEEEPQHVRVFEDDRNTLESGDRKILVVEDDPNFSKILYDISRSFGFKTLRAVDAEQALNDIREHRPQGIILDMKLPGVSGLGLLESLKSDPKTRHIPIHVVSGIDISHNALRMGAVGYLMKPVDVPQLRGAFQKIEDLISRKVRRVLIVEDEERQRLAISRLIRGGDVETDAVGLASEARQRLKESTYDCMILDLRLPDQSGLELLAELSRDEHASHPPVIIYTGKDLSRDEVMMLRHYSDSIIIKGVRSPERLVDEVSLFLHRVEADLPDEQQKALNELRRGARPFQEQSVLLVDDDLRNTFALMSALEPKGLKISVARNGKEALAKLQEGPNIDLVLMDIMMPEMDGYTAMREIRKIPSCKSLPIIALTAKAMRGDQEKCIEAGANDYLPKPIDLERLLSVLRAWLPSKDEFLP